MAGLTALRRLGRIKFDANSNTCADQYGFQEVDQYGDLVHLYDNEGDQLDSGNGNFPSASWTLTDILGDYTADDTDEFWRLISESQGSTVSESVLADLPYKFNA